MDIPELPSEVLEIIWMYVRADLIPRMNRKNPLYLQLKLESVARLLFLYGQWIHREYATFFTHISPLIAISKCLDMFNLCDIKVISDERNTGIIIQHREQENMWMEYKNSVEYRNMEHFNLPIPHIHDTSLCLCECESCCSHGQL